MMDFITTMSGAGTLIALAVFCVFIPYCLSGEDGDENEFAAMAWLIVGAAAIVVLVGAVPDWRVILIGTPVYFAIGALWFLYRWRALDPAQAGRGARRVGARRPRERRRRPAQCARDRP